LNDKARIRRDGAGSRQDGTCRVIVVAVRRRCFRECKREGRRLEGHSRELVDQSD
jgi:hypothetical protein